MCNVYNSDNNINSLNNYHIHNGDFTSLRKMIDLYYIINCFLNNDIKNKHSFIRRWHKMINIIIMLRNEYKILQTTKTTGGKHLPDLISIPTP